MNTVTVAVYRESLGVKIIAVTHSTPEEAVRYAKDQLNTLSEVLSTHQYAVRIDLDGGISILWDAINKGKIMNGDSKKVLDIRYLIESHHPLP